MSFHANRRPQPPPWWERWWPAGLLALAAVGGGAAVASAPQAARGWVSGCVIAGWLCLAAAIAVGRSALRRRQALLTRTQDDIRQLQDRAQRQARAVGALGDTTLPTVAGMLRDGAGVSHVLATLPPQDEPHRRIIEAFAAAVTDQQDTERRLTLLTGELDLVINETMPYAIRSLADGQTATRVLHGLEMPADPRLRGLVDTMVRALGISERRSAAGRGASAKALGRVQAKTVSILADLRDMEDRYEGEIFHDLLQLDHKASQLGMETDRIALLMDGRASRAWNRPIVMESILRGAIGRIAAYQRVRLHCASEAAVVGFAAEGLMHLLAELTDNATKFSPPIDIVPVYVEEASAGVVITIEDSGLKMADAAMVRAEEAVSGRNTDLAYLPGTRLGLAVVGRLAAKYGVNVNFRPSSRGGTGVVVLIPTRLIAQEIDHHQLRAGLPEVGTAAGRANADGVRPGEIQPNGGRPQAPPTPTTAAPSAPDSPPPPPAPAPAPDTAEAAPTGHPPHTPETAPAPAGPVPDPLPQVPSPAAAPDALPRRVRRSHIDAAGPADAAGTADHGRRHAAPATGTASWSTPNGLPVRPAGRTMAAAHTGQDEHPDASAARAAPAAPRRDVGAQFGAFHRSRKTGSRSAPASTDRPGDGADTGPDGTPGATPPADEAPPRTP